MAVSYKRLFKLLIDRDMMKKDLCKKANISSATLAKLANGDNVTMEVLERICLSLGCNIEDIVEILPDSVAASSANWPET